MQSVLESKGYSQFDDCLVPMTIADHDHDDEVEDNVSEGTNEGASSGANMIFTISTRSRILNDAILLPGVVGVVRALWTVVM
jgi:hypothetical protein